MERIERDRQEEMPQTASNIEKLRTGYRLWHETRGGSVDYWLNLIAEDVAWYSLADGVPGMDHVRHRVSKAEVQDYFAELANNWEMLYYTVSEFIEQGDRVVMIGKCGWRYKPTGQSIDSPKIDFFRFQDGQIVEFWEFYDTAKAMAACVAR